MPAAGPNDHRVKYVDYREAEVVRITGTFGYSTHVTFAAREAVTGVVLGDTLAWEVAPVANHLFIKPREENATTNMTVLTDKGRAYTFFLDARPRPTRAKQEDLFFRVSFRYPDDEAKAKAAKEDAERVARAAMEPPKREIRNIDYHACGAAEVTPDQAFDDGRFTYLRFAGNREFPAVFVVNPDGSESLVNSHTEADTVVVHRLANKLVFRRGESAGCVVNKSYDPVGVPLFNGTSDAALERVVREATP